MLYAVVRYFFVLFSSSLAASLAPMAYICNAGTNTVSVIDTSNNSIVATIPVGTNPYNSVLTPDGRYLYIATFGEYSVSVVDTTHNTLYTTISLPATGGSYPQDIAITPDGKYVYVVIGGDNTANNTTVIDTATNTIFAVIDLPSNSYPELIAITPDGNYAYVFGGDTNLYIISTQTNSIIGSPIGGFNNPYDVVFSVDGAYAYVSIEATSASINAVNTSSYTVSSIDLTGTAPGAELAGLCVTPDGFYIYTVDAVNPYVYVVDTRNNQTVASIPATFGGLQLIAPTPDGNSIYFSGNFGTNPGLIGVIDTQSNQVINTIAIPAIGGDAPNPEGITITPLLPPSTFIGVQKTNNFGVARERFNALTWTPSVSAIDGYLLTRNGQFLTTLTPTAVAYQDHNRPLYQNTTYTLEAFNNAGSVSYASPTTVIYKT